MSADPIAFTIVIATCNRPDRLRRTLDAVCSAIRGAKGEHRIVVVDNGPERPASETVTDFREASDCDIVRCTSAPRSKAAALNRGIREARTQWLAFTDDDTLPDAGWLREAQAYIRAGGCPIFSGRIMAGDPEQPLPKWLEPGRAGRRPVLGSAMVQYDPMPESGVLGAGHPVPFGANMFVHRGVFEKHGLYDEALWNLCGAAALGVEDGEFGIRVRRRGQPIGYCREAVVVHPIHHARCTMRSHILTAYRYGWRDPLVYVDEKRPAWEWFRLKLMATRLLGAAVHLLRRDPAAAMANIEDVAVSAGNMIGRLSAAYRVQRCRSNGVSG